MLKHTGGKYLSFPFTIGSLEIELSEPIIIFQCRLSNLPLALDSRLVVPGFDLSRAEGMTKVPQCLLVQQIAV